MVEPPPPPLQPSPPLPQAPPTPSVMWGPLPWVAAGGWTKPQCARPRARGTTAACWGRVGPLPPEVGAGALPPTLAPSGAGGVGGLETQILVPTLLGLS